MSFGSVRRKSGIAFTACDWSGSALNALQLFEIDWHLCLFRNCTGRCTQIPEYRPTARGKAGQPSSPVGSPNPVYVCFKQNQCRICKLPGRLGTVPRVLSRYSEGAQGLDRQAQGEIRQKNQDESLVWQLNIVVHGEFVGMRP